MSSNKPKSILFVTEGPDDKSLVKRLHKKFGLPEYEIICLKANLKRLYTEYESYGCDYSDLDVTAVLRSCKQTGKQDREKLEGKSAKDFTDIYLVFDFDPHTGDFDADAVKKMMDHFCDSSDAGKLYIDYPMLESFFHMPSEVLECDASENIEIQYRLSELTGYKQRVNKEGFRYSDSHTKEQYERVIRRHAAVVAKLTGVPIKDCFKVDTLQKLFGIQLKNATELRCGTVVNTFCLMFPEVYPRLCRLDLNDTDS